MANGNSSMGLNHTSSPPTSHRVGGQNGGSEGTSPATPVDLSTVPSLGTWAEMQESCVRSNRGQTPGNHETTSRNMRLNEPNSGEEITFPRTEYREAETDSEMDKNPFWVNSRT